MEGKGPATNQATAAPEARQARAPAGASGEPPADAGQQQGEDEAEIEISGDGTVRDLKTGRFVRHEAYVRTKNELKASKERTDQLAAEVFRSRERLAILTELSQPAQAHPKEEDLAAAPDIDPEADIFGYLKQQEARRRAADEKNAAKEAQKETQSLNNYVVSDATRFVNEKPDFQNALSHLMAVQDKIETRMGNADPASRAEAVNQALRAVVKKAYQSGKSWAEDVYEFALIHGYRPPAAQAQQDVSQEAREGIDRINRGQAAAVSMRNSGTGGTPEAMTLLKLAEMSEKDYMQTRNDYIAKNGAAAWNAFESGKRVW